MLVRPAKMDDVKGLTELSKKAGRGLTTMPKTAAEMTQRIEHYRHIRSNGSQSASRRCDHRDLFLGP